MLPFRISVALHYFFQDKRSLSYILIDDRFSTIKDLQNHIQQIFSIRQNVYLTCNNHLLPVSEGVEIVKRDETIIVVQDDFNQHDNQNTTNVKITSRPERHNKRKNVFNESSEDPIEDIHINKSQNINKTITIENNILNRKCEISNNKESSDTNSLLNFLVLDNVNTDQKLSPIEYDEIHLETNLSDEKQSSSKLSVFDESIDCTAKRIKQDDNTVNSVNVKIIENKIISEQQSTVIQNIESNTYEKLVLKNTPEQKEWNKDFNSINKKNILWDSQNKDKYVENKETSDKFGSLANTCGKNNVLEVNLSDDSINKVTSSDLYTMSEDYKFSYYNMPQKTNKYNSSQVKNNSNIHTTNNISEDNKSLSDSCIISETCTKMCNGNSDQKIELNVNDLQSTTEKNGFFDNPNNDLFALKKTRKRKRKRNPLKRYDITNEHFSQISHNRTLNKINFSDSTKQRIHIRFSDNDVSDSELSSFEQNRLHNEYVDKDNCKNDNEDEKKSNILLNKNTSLESIIQKINLKTKELDNSLFKLIHKETLPSINDIIAFKIFQLNEVYEPYITDWIIGTVTNLKSSVIDIKILAGKIKTSEPKGKFYMENEDEKPEVNEYETQLNWSVMINPHILLT